LTVSTVPRYLREGEEEGEGKRRRRKGEDDERRSMEYGIERRRERAKN
jgi:hypothetical protein